MTVLNPSTIPCSTGLQTDRPMPGWQPDAVGLPRAVAVSVALVGLLMGGLVLLAGRVAPPAPPPPVTVQLMDAASAMSTPAVTAAPPPPAEAVPPPLAAMSPPGPVAEAAPLPVMEPLAPVPSPIAVTTPEQPVPAPPPVVPPRPEPRPRPTRRATRPLPPTRDRGDVAAMVDVARDMPAPADAPHAVIAPPAPADVSSGLGPYSAGLHRQIERNMLSDGTVGQLGVSGTAVIEATIARDGRVVSARLARSSGVRAIDDAALRAVQRGGFPPFRSTHAGRSDHGQRADRGPGGLARREGEQRGRVDGQRREGGGWRIVEARAVRPHRYASGCASAPLRTSCPAAPPGCRR